MNKNKLFDDSKVIIHPEGYIFLYILIKYVFFGKEGIKEKTYLKLIKFTEKLSERGFNINLENIENNRKEKDKIEIIKTFKIIFDFTKVQNIIYSPEIIENILIMIFSFGFDVNQSDSFGKYIYNNLEMLSLNDEIKTKIVSDWFVNDNLKSFINLYDILNFDSSDENIDIQINPLLELLMEICFLKNIKYCKIIYNSQQRSIKSYNTSIYSNYYNNFAIDKNVKLGEVKKDIIKNFGEARSFFISVYIYCHNKNNPLINYFKDSENLINLPFIYELSEADINDKFIGIVLSPVRIEQRIIDIEMNENRFQHKGIFELFSALLFNKNIKKISINNCYLKPIYLKNIFDNFPIFINKNVEVLNISDNYLKSDVDHYLAKVISILRGLKTLNISNNYLKCGLAPFFVSLKNLYRLKKSKLETLIMFNCYLDDISFYELGELLKSKYCLLKNLCLNMNSIPSDINFFNSLKKNKSLKRIYLYECGIGSNKRDEIDRIISNTNIEVLYLGYNKIHDLNQIIRIIYRNSLIKNNEDKFFCDNPCLYNLNLNNNNCYNKNIEKIELIKNGIKSINLSCLDLTGILKEYNINNEKKQSKNNKAEKINKGIDVSYEDEIQNFQNDLKEESEKYKKNLIDTLYNKSKVEIKKNIII